MQIGVLGVNHKSSKISVRECMAKACQNKISKESLIAERFSCVVLSTCHRTEIYFSAPNLAEAHSEILQVLRREIALAFEHELYSYFGFDCFLHLGYVVSGLDSVIIAESEIQRQVKVAYEQSQWYYPLPSCLHFLFQKSLKIGKEIRGNILLSQGKMNIPKMLFHISGHVVKNLPQESILFIGNSEINRQVMNFFRAKGINRISLCTRGTSAWEETATLPWEERVRWGEFSIVICGSNAPHYAIEPFQREHPVQTRLIFDLSVPRTVSPELARHPLLTLLNMEEIGQMLDQYQTKNGGEIQCAEQRILERVEGYLLSFREKAERALLCI